MSDKTYDFVIVGGGTAGCVLANRLSADPGNKVVLLEAGKSDPFWDVLTHMPAAMGLVLKSKWHNWKFVSEPEPFMKGRRMDHPRGKLLGGSGSVNAMTYVRGHRASYDLWAELTGSDAWDFAHLLPYFRRIENSLTFGPDEIHGKGGPQVIAQAAADHPLFARFFEAARQAGYPLIPDLNGPDAEGFAPFELNILRGRRHSPSQAYLHPVLSRRNLEVRTHAMATQIIFAGRRATGVTYRTATGTERVVRGKEIILAGGSFNSPQLLQLSGVGNSEELAAVGVAPVHHLPGVGYNLEDHLCVQISHACTEPVSLNIMKDKRTWPKMAAQWLVGKGLATGNLFEAAGYIRTNDDMQFPDVLVGFAPMAMAFDPKRQVQGHGYQVHVATLAARARGSVTLRSKDPLAHPRIILNYLDNERDRADWVKAIRAARDLFAQPAFADIDGGEVAPGPEFQTDAEILDWVQTNAQTNYHPTGSTRMGRGEQDVVDPDTLRVHGLEGIRVADAGVFPAVPNAQTYAAVLMVGEKASDIILGNTPLPPAPLVRPQAGGSAARPAAPAEVAEPVTSG